MSDSVRPHRRQPTRLCCPWDSPGKNTGVGCHFLLQCMKVKSESEIAQSCLTLSNPMDCSSPGSSVHGIFQARVLEWDAIAFSDYCSYKKGNFSDWHTEGKSCEDTRGKKKSFMPKRDLEQIRSSYPSKGTKPAYLREGSVTHWERAPKWRSAGVPFHARE